MKIEVYKSKNGWRWRVKASNGKIIAASSESYVRRGACLNNLVRVSQILEAVGLYGPYRFIVRDKKA